MTITSTTTDMPRPWADREACCPTREPCMTVHDLAVSYAAKPALHNVDLSIHRNCITAIIGPSGCGKSTFLTCLNRMTDLVPGCRVTGRVEMDQADITNGTVNLIALRRRVGMIFQKPNPLPLSIRKNLTFPLKQHGLRRRSERDAQAEIAFRRVGLWEEVKDRLNAPASGLSGGQQQRLCIARALALDPRVLLMDEPCSALDPIASGVVEDLIASLRGKYTVAVVTHNLAQARRIADDVAMFWVRDGAGTVVESGRARHVFESPRSEITAAYLRGERG